MIKSELAQKLKKAGYPHIYFDTVTSKDGIIGICNERFPTLSQLIEDCGDKFGQLGSAVGGFNAWITSIREPKAFGETPEEAIANLWLKINE